MAPELKSLLVHPETRKDIDETAVSDYFTFGYVPDPKSIFTSIRKLSPGHYIEVENGQIEFSQRQYWDIEFDASGPCIDEEIVTNELLEHIDAATRRRMVADVPLGAFLSGGVDSSAVVASMAAAGDQAVNTCSISFGDAAYNESAYADQVARLFHTNHRVENVDTDDFSLVDAIPRIYDEPFADSSALPTYRVCELARRHVTVALSGDGGDEIFAGYRRYRWHMNEHLVRRNVPAGIRESVFGPLGRWYPKLDWAPRVLRAKSTLQALARSDVAAYLHSVSILPNDLHGKIFSSDFQRKLGEYSSMEVFDEHIRNCNTDDQLSIIQYLDIKTYLPGDILTKVDRASMANSLEVRAPLLDHDLATWASKLPSSLKLRGGEGKFLLKKALGARLPPDILYRDKMGFAVPLAAWFRGPLRAAVRSRLLGTEMAGSGIFSQAKIEKLVEDHESGARDFSAAIWALLMFQGFFHNVYE